MFAALLVVTTLGWVDSHALTYDIRPQSRLTVQETVEQMIDLLEAKQYRRLIVEYAHPRMLDEVRQEQLFDEVVRMMGEAGLGDELLAALRQFNPHKLEYNADRSEAVFHVLENPGDIDKLTFGKHEGIWYVKE